MYILWCLLTNIEHNLSHFWLTHHPSVECLHVCQGDVTDRNNINKDRRIFILERLIYLDLLFVQVFAYSYGLQYSIWPNNKWKLNEIQLKNTHVTHRDNGRRVQSKHVSLSYLIIDHLKGACFSVKTSKSFFNTWPCFNRGW